MCNDVRRLSLGALAQARTTSTSRRWCAARGWTTKAQRSASLTRTRAATTAWKSLIGTREEGTPGRAEASAAIEEARRRLENGGEGTLGDLRRELGLLLASFLHLLPPLKRLSLLVRIVGPLTGSRTAVGLARKISPRCVWRLGGPCLLGSGLCDHFMHVAGLRSNARPAKRDPRCSSMQ